MLGHEHDGCHVSGEFPTFAVKRSVEAADSVSKYVVHSLNSPQYLALVDSLSTGSTKQSRNRFNQKLFLDLLIQMPTSPDGLRRVVSLLDKASQLRTAQEQTLDLVKALREGISLLLPKPARGNGGRQEVHKEAQDRPSTCLSTPRGPSHNNGLAPRKVRRKGKRTKQSKKRKKSGQKKAKRRRGPRRER